MPLMSLPQTNNPPTSLLRRYYPVLLTGAALTVAYLTYNVYQSRPTDPERSSSARLQRSNATRNRNRERRDQRGEQSEQQREQAPREAPPSQIQLSQEQLDQLINRATAGSEASWAEIDNRTFEQALAEAIVPELPLTAEEKQNQNLLNLLYHIAEDNAKREGYIHRGVTCNGCGINPIRGIRYRCSNCVDFDLCEHCEAAESHPKTHLFFKVRIPAPFLGSPKQVFQPWYPGKPNMMVNSLDPELSKSLQEEGGFDQSEIEALYEQFKCMAATEFPNDPLRLHGGISRPTFDKCFFPSCGQRPAKPNLIYDRMFDFYDTNGDGLIDFKEFIMGLAALSSKSRGERLKRIFRGYDFDGDGVITRSDFLKMFKAYYALQKDLIKDTVAVMEDDVLEQTAITAHLMGSQPVSAIFTGSIPQSSPRITKPAGTDPDQDFDGVTAVSGTDTVESSTPVVVPESTEDAMRRRNNREATVIGLSGAASITAFQTRVDNEEDAARSTAAQASESVGRGHTDEPGSEQDLDEMQSLRNSVSSLPLSTPPAVVTPSSLPHSHSPSFTEGDHSPIDPEVEFIPAQARPSAQTSAPPHIPPQQPSTKTQETAKANKEILYEITKQGLNELLDIIFKHREEAAKEHREKKEEQRRRRKEREAKKAEAARAAAEKEAAEFLGEMVEVEGEGKSPADTVVQTPREKAPEPVPAKPHHKTHHREGKEKREKSDKEHKERKHKHSLDPKIAGITYEEFERLMHGDKGRKLAFVGAWVEMVSF